MTITATPPAYSSVQGDLIYTVSDATKTSDPVTYPNFKFIGDVYIGATLVARISRMPDPSTGIGVFNIGQVVRNYLSAVFNPTAGALVAQAMGDGVFSVTVTMHFGEEWDYTPTYDIVVDSARQFFNSYSRRFVGFTSALSLKTDNIASNRPFSTGQVFLTSSYLLVPYFPTTGAAVPVVVTPIGGGAGFTTSFTPSANVLQVLNLSPAALNAIHAGAITAATSSYAVQIGAQTYSFQVICEPIYQPYMIHFLNQYGGFDSKMFSKVSRKTYDVTRKDYGRLPYTIDGSGQVIYSNANGVYNESRAVYSSQYIEKMSLNTDLLSDVEYSWLTDLLVSPMVYIEDQGYIYPVSITDTNYEPKKYINDDLTNLTINIQFGNQLNAQYR